MPKEVAWKDNLLTDAAYKAVLDCILAEAESIRGKRPNQQLPESEKRRRSGPERTVIEINRPQHASEGSRHSKGDRTRHSSDGGYSHHRDERYGHSSDRYRYRY